MKKTAKSAVSVFLAIILVLTMVSGMIVPAAENRQPSAAVAIYCLPIGVVGQPYNAQLLSFDDQGYTHTLEIIEGWLPFGLTLNNDGSVTGIPTQTWQSSYESCVEILVSWEGTSKTRSLGYFYFCVEEEAPTPVFTTPPSSTETLNFDTYIDVPANSQKIYKFLAPSTWINKGIEWYGEYDDEMNYLSGGCTARLYDAQGLPVASFGEYGTGAGDKSLAFDEYTLTPGETYYIFVEGDESQPTTFIVETSKQANIENILTGGGESTTNDEYYKEFGDEPLTKTASNVKKTFDGESSTTWDVWTYKYVEDCDFDVRYGLIQSYYHLPLVAGFKAYFQNGKWVNDWGSALLYIDELDEPPEIYDEELGEYISSTSDIVLNEGEQLTYYGFYQSSHFGSLHVQGIATFTVDIYVPVGSSLRTDSEGGIREGLPTTRLGGQSRVQTAIEISKQDWDKADTVLLATGMNFADALVGSPLAYELNAPILLTANGKSKNLEDEILTRLDELEAKNIILLGGTGVISSDIENSLKKLKFNVERLAGNDRFATSVAIAQRLEDARNGAKPTQVFFVDAYNFPDALAVSPVAALTGSPILFVTTASRTDGKVLNSSIQSYLTACGDSVTDITAVGGPTIVGDEVLAQAKGITGAKTTDRVYGNSRNMTAVEIYKKYKPLFTGDCVAFAVSSDFPDALAGSVLAANNGSPIFLIDKHETALSEIRNAIKNQDPKMTFVFGGIGALPENVINKYI